MYLIRNPLSKPLRPSLNRDTVSLMKSSQAIREAVAAEIRAALARDGRSAAELAASTDISPSALSRKLRGQVPFWTEEVLIIAAELHVEPGSLLGLKAVAS